MKLISDDIPVIINCLKGGGEGEEWNEGREGGGKRKILGDHMTFRVNGEGISSRQQSVKGEI